MGNEERRWRKKGFMEGGEKNVREWEEEIERVVMSLWV